LRSSLKNLFSSGLEIKPGEAVELAVLGDLGRGADEGVHGRSRASEPPTLIRRTPIAAMSLTVKAECACAVEEIHRLRRHRLHHRLDLLARFDARRIEAIGAGRL
jgi:regulator of protease activity HflC (stomatin/prohibitin superfamily)